MSRITGSEPSRLSWGSYAWPPTFPSVGEEACDWFLRIKYANEWASFYQDFMRERRNLERSAGTNEEFLASQSFEDLMSESAWASFRFTLHPTFSTEPGAVILEARERFLRAVRTVEPRVLHDLRGEPFRAYVDAHRLKPLRQLDRTPQLGVHPFGLAGAPEAAVAAYFDELDGWAQRWQITANWWLGRASRTVACWRSDLDNFETATNADESLDWEDFVSSGAGWAWTPERLGQAPTLLDWWASQGLAGTLPLDDKDIVFRFADQWMPWEERREDAMRRFRDRFEAAIAEYFCRNDRLMMDSGWVRVPEKREPAHFEWLVQYQVQGTSYSKIARAACKERKSVSDAVTDLADFIRLPIRLPSRPGRPRKSSG